MTRLYDNLYRRTQTVSRRPYFESFWPVSLLFVAYIVVAIYLGIVLNFDFLRSDVASYWQDSLAWKTPFDPFHVPGYPLAVAALRGITLALLPASILMMGLNLGALLVCGVLIYRIIEASGASARLVFVAPLLFGLWPLVGLTYTVYPLAEVPAMALLLGGFHSLQKRCQLPAALLLGLAAVTHKGTWLIVALLVLADLLQRRNRPRKQIVLFVGLTILPVTVLWLAGTYYHQSVTWLFASNLEVEVASRGSSVLLDGLIGTLEEGGAMGAAKSLLLITFFIIASISLYLTTLLKYSHWHLGVAIALGVLIYFLVLNQHEIWAAVRFSRLLTIPIVMALSSRYRSSRLPRWFLPVTMLAVLLLLLSQFAYSWYMARVFFA